MTTGSELLLRRPTRECPLSFCRSDDHRLPWGRTWRITRECVAKKIVALETVLGSREAPARRPLGELDLCNHLRFQPNAVLLSFSGERSLYALLLWQAGEWTNGDFQSFQLLPNFTTKPGHEAVSHFAGKHQLVTFIVADDQRIQRVVWGVAADNERLPLVHLVFEPRAAAFARLVAGVLALGYHAFKPELFHKRNQLGWCGVDGLRQAYVGRAGFETAITSTSSSRLLSSGT